MIIGVLAPAAVLGTIVLLGVLFLRRDGIDLTPRGLLRLYLYIASLAGIVVLTIGAASVVNYGLARVAGDEFIYGGEPARPFPRPVCPPEAVGKGCVEPTPEELERQRVAQVQQRERQRNEDLLRGATYTVFGALFWTAHWGARRGLGERDPGTVALRRGYLMLGTVVFGIATIVLLPTGTYQALANVLLEAPEGYYRQGADALGGGLVTLVVWLAYLRLVVAESRQAA